MLLALANGSFDLWMVNMFQIPALKANQPTKNFPGEVSKSVAEKDFTPKYSKTLGCTLKMLRTSNHLDPDNFESHLHSSQK